MSFRVVLFALWILIASGSVWFLRGGFGIRVPRAFQSWLPASSNVWILWAWAALLVVGVSLLAAYLLAKGLHMAAPRFVR
jgi:hypothetical protein